MKKVAVIGAGVSGLSISHFLKAKYEVTTYEKEEMPGGLIRCKRVNNCLFHICGGHVFNSKREDVLEWFWSFFDKNKEFVKSERNSVIYIKKGTIVPYPIENHVYLLDKDVQLSFISDLFKINHGSKTPPNDFDTFLRETFGNTLYELYFKPYNQKIWQRNLKKIPISWLDGKLPMPSVKDMIYNNMNHVKEKTFVHSTFWYEKYNGSQYIADKLAHNINIRYNTEINSIEYKNHKWRINDEIYDIVIYCGNIKQMVSAIKGINIETYSKAIELLEYHGTTSVFCEIDKNPFSWIYLPNLSYDSHRIICTANFAQSNCSNGIFTATIEFTDRIEKDAILNNLKLMPYRPKYITHHYNKYTYPIQNRDTREMISSLKKELERYNFYFTGRFADWEYYNMDTAIGAAMDLAKNI